MALSGGQQQRLCIARTIAPEPEVVLLDEPTSALDPLATQRIEELVFELKRDFTIVIVTHNMQQAARVSDTTTFFYLGDHGGARRRRGRSSRPRGRADRGLHHRTVRMTGRSAAPPDFATTRPTLAPRQAAPVDTAHPPWRRGASASHTDRRRSCTGIDLKIPPQAVTAIIGPSGCGKSTFLRSINRLNDLVAARATPASMLVDGRDVFGAGMDLVVLRRRVGMVFQRPNPFPKSIYDNVAYGPALNGSVAEARPARPRGALPAAGRPVGRGEGPARRARHRRCPAASSSGSASRGRSATSPRCC